MPNKITKQLATELPLVAIDIGGQSVRAIAAQEIAPDTLQILGYEESSRQACTANGVVVQTSNASFMIVEVLRLLANRIGRSELPTAFVLLGGANMRVVAVHSRRDLARPHPITENILEDMERECKSKIEANNPNVAVLGLVPGYYVLDDVEQEQRPTQKQRARFIESHYSAFLGRIELEEKVQASFDRTPKAIEQTFVRPDALLSAFSYEDPEALNRGCAVLDLGAQTATLSVYVSNQYLINNVSTMGGMHITESISQQSGVPMNIAEKMKCMYGCAAPEYVEKNFIMSGTAGNGETWKMSCVNLSAIICATLDKMLDPLMAELNMRVDQVHRLFVTGGGSLLQGIIPYLQSKTSIEVVYGCHAGLLSRDTPDEFCSPKYASLIGALVLGGDYRKSHPDNVIKLSKMKKLEDTILTIFTEQQQ